jgi:hypothetical protein
VKSLAPNSNRASISIYNLSSQGRKSISSTGIWCELYAGYLGQENLLFAGEIKGASAERDGADIIFSIQCQTDWKLLNILYANSFPKGTAVKDIVLDILKKSNLPYSENSVLVSGTVTVGSLSFAHNVEKSLNKLGKMFNFTWSLQDYGFLAMDDGVAYANSQKLETLVKTAEITPKQNDRSVNGFVLTCVLNSSFAVGDLVTFTSLYNASEQFKIYEIFYYGDTFDGEWSMDIEGFVPGSRIVEKPKSKAAPSFWTSQRNSIGLRWS